MLLTPLRLVLVLQYFTSPSFMVLSSLVRRHHRSFVVHLLEPAINRSLYGDLCNLEVQDRCGRFWSSSNISHPTDVMKWLWLFTIVSNESFITWQGPCQVKRYSRAGYFRFAQVSNLSADLLCRAQGAFLSLLCVLVCWARCVIAKYKTTLWFEAKMASQMFNVANIKYCFLSNDGHSQYDF